MSVHFCSPSDPKKDKKDLPGRTLGRAGHKTGNKDHASSGMRGSRVADVASVVNTTHHVDYEKNQ